MEEIWKHVKNYEGVYMVSNLGNVMSMPKKTRKGSRIMKPLKQRYSTVDLCLNGCIIKKTVHRLVAEAFILNSENKPQVNHINGNKHDNRLCNLEWCTHSENQKHAIKEGLRTAKGVKNSQSKLGELDVINIYKSTKPNNELSNIYNISVPSISGIRNNKTWTHITKNL